MTASSPTILLVEDDPALGREIQASLEQAGFSVTWATTGRDAERERHDDYALVILDLMLPERHGFDVLKTIRSSSDVPVLILTARSETPDKVRGFQLGADDYVTKPFWPAELLARVEARLRRPVLQRDEGLVVGPLRFDFDRREIWHEDVVLELTRVEYDLLSFLAHRLDKPVTRAQLVDHVLDEEREGGARTLDVHISRIRKKLGPAAAHLATVWGIGYRLASEPGSK